MDAAVRIENLNFSHGQGALQRRVLNDISVRFMPGGVTVLTGASGSGKSTLLTIIGGLRRAESGSVRVLGTELVGAGEAQRVAVRRRIGFIFQRHNLAPALTVRQNIRMGLQLGPPCDEKEARARIEQAAARVGLSDHLDKHPNELSGGQQQRAGVARALVNEPLLILADEPTASLDRDSGEAVVALLNELAERQNSTVLLVTHDKRILERADALLTLEDGCIVQPSDGLLHETSQVVRALRRIERGHLGELLGFGSALAQVALADGRIDEAEIATMRRELARAHIVSDAEMEFVVELAIAMAEGWQGRHGDPGRRAAYAAALEAVAAADHVVDEAEHRLIRQLMDPPIARS